MTFTWSYSRLKNYETCPKRHYHYDIAKDVVEPETMQIGEGKAAHKAFEERIRHERALPLPLLQYEGIMAKLAAMPGETYAETKLGIDRNYKPVGFFGKGVWFRTIIDFTNIHNRIAAVIDYKMGRPNPDMTQLQLMSATIMHYNPAVQRVRARLLFLNHNTAERAEFVRGNLGEIWAETLPRVARLEEAVGAGDFPPVPGGLCKRYCKVTSCPYNGRGTQ